MVFVVVLVVVIVVVPPLAFVVRARMVQHQFGNRSRAAIMGGVNVFFGGLVVVVVVVLFVPLLVV